MSSAGVVSIRAQIEGDADVKRLQQSLKGLKQETIGLNRPMGQAGKSIDGVGQSSTKVTTQVRSMGDRVQQAGSGMALAGAAAVSLWNAYDNVTDSAQKVTIAEGRLEGAERRLSVARETLNKLQASGTASALDLQQAQQGVAAAEAMVERANLGLTNSQEALNEAWLNAATSIIPSIFTGVTGVTQVYQSLTSTVDESIDSYLRQAAALQGSGVELVEAAGNTTEFAVATTDAASSTLEMGDAATEMGSAMTELGANSLESASAISEVGSTVAETGADIGEFAGDAVEMSGALTEVGSTAIEAGANMGEFAADVTEAASATVELGADVTEFSGDILEASGNIVEATGTSIEFGSTMGEVANNVATVGGALVETEAAVVQTAVAMQRTGANAARMGANASDAAAATSRLATANKELAPALASTNAAMAGKGGLLGIGLGAKIAIIAGAIVGVAAAMTALRKNFMGIRDAARGFIEWIEKGVDSIPGLGGAIDWLIEKYKQLEGALFGFLENIPHIGDFFKSSTAATEEAAAANDELAPSIAAVNSEISKLSPWVQHTAQAWGVYTVESDKATEGQKRMIDHMQKLDAQYKTAQQGVIDFATANGVDLWTALNMTEEEMLAYALNLDAMGPTAEQAAEQTAQAAQKFAESWKKAFDDASAALGSWTERLSSGVDAMSEEFGEKMEVGLSDVEKTIKRSPMFNQQFWDELFPEDFIGAAVVKGMDTKDIAKELRDLWDDVVEDGKIPEDDAAKLFEPLLDFMEHELPGDMSGSMGKLAGSLPDLEKHLRPKLVMGMFEVGADAVEALRTSLVNPLEKILSQGMGAEKAGPAMLAHLRSVLPQISAFNADLGALLGTVFVDQFTGQERPLKDQIGKLLAILKEVDLSDQLETMDLNANQMADIFEKGPILSAVDTFKLGILEAFQTIFEAMGRTDWANALQREIDDITNTSNTLIDTLEEADGSMSDAAASAEELAGAISTSEANAQDMINQFDGLSTVTGFGHKVSDEFKESLKGMNAEQRQAAIDAYEATNKVDLFADGIENTWTNADHLTESLGRANAAMDAIMEKAKFEETDPTFGLTPESGVLSDENFWGPLGGKPEAPKTNPFLDSLTKSITDGIKAIPGMIETAFTQTLPAIGAAIGEGLRGAATYISTTLQDPVFQSAVLDGIYNLFKGVSGLLAPIGQALWEGLVHTATWISTTLQNPQFQSAVLDGVYNLFQTIGGLLQPLGEQLWSALVSTASWISTTLQDPQFQSAVLDGIWNLFQTVGSMLRPLGETMWSGLVATADYIKTTLQDPAFQQAAIEGIAWFVGEAGKWVTSNAQTLAATFQTGFNAMAAQLPGVLGAAIGSTTGTLSAKVLEGLANATTDLPDKLTAFFRDTQAFFDAVYNGFIGLFTHPEGVAKAVGEFPQKIQDAFTGVNFQDAFNKAFGEAFAAQGGNEAYQRLVGNVGSLLNWINKGLSELPGKIQQGLTGLASQMGSAIAAGLTSAFSGAAEAIKNAIIGENGLWGQIKAGLSELPGMVGGWFSENPIVQGLADLFKFQSGTGGEPKIVKTSGGGGPQISGDDPTFNQRNKGGGGGGIDTSMFDAYKTALTDLLTHAQSVVTQLAVLWTGHAAAVGAQVTAVVTGPLASYARELVALQNGVQQVVVTGIVTSWSESRNGIASNINGIVQVMANMAREYVALGNGVQQVVVNSVVTSWSASRNGISSNINGIVQSMANLAREYVALRNGVIQVLSAGNNAWRQHSGILAQAASSGSSSVSRLSNAVRSNMSSIVSAMNNATSAANRLRSAINSLQSKTITVTTRYRTTGSPGGGTRRAATGFSGVVDQPTRMFVGEGNKPELVQVTPLTSSGGRVSMNKAAATSNMFQQPTIRAGGSTAKVTPGGGGHKYIHEDRMARWVDDMGWKLKEYDPESDGDIRVVAKRRSGKKRKMTQEKAREFAAKHGYDLPRYYREDDGRILIMLFRPRGGAGGGGDGGGTGGSPRAATDPLLLPARHGGIVGRGGKSLFDLGIASRTNIVPVGATVHPDGRIEMGGGNGNGGPHKYIHEDAMDRWANKYGYDLKDYEPEKDNDIRAAFRKLKGKKQKMTQDIARSFAAEHGYGLPRYYRDDGLLRMLFRPGKGGDGGATAPVTPRDRDRDGGGGGGGGGGGNSSTRYITSKYDKNRKIDRVVYYEDGSGRVYYKDGGSQQIRHNHPGPFTSGDRKVRAKHGWSGFVDKPTEFLAGEAGREYVNIQPIKDWANNMATNARSMAGKYGGGAGGRPVIIELHVKSELDGKVISESIRKELLGGIYSMT